MMMEYIIFFIGGAIFVVVIVTAHILLDRRILIAKTVLNWHNQLNAIRVCYLTPDQRNLLRQCMDEVYSVNPKTIKYKEFIIIEDKVEHYFSDLEYIYG